MKVMGPSQKSQFFNFFFTLGQKNLKSYQVGSKKNTRVKGGVGPQFTLKLAEKRAGPKTQPSTHPLSSQVNV